MDNNYACVMGMSKNNKIDEPADFWQVIFHKTEEECKEGKRLGYILAYTKHEKFQDETVKKLNNKIKNKISEDWGLMWKKIENESWYNGTSGYFLVNGDGKLIIQFYKEKVEVK
jgi:hypothetical protein